MSCRPARSNVKLRLPLRRSAACYSFWRCLGSGEAGDLREHPSELVEADHQHFDHGESLVKRSSTSGLTIFMLTRSHAQITAVSWRVSTQSNLLHTGRAVVQQWDRKKSARWQTTAATTPCNGGPPPLQAHYDTAFNADKQAHLDPSPDSYSSAPFTDQCVLTVKAGGGGHGCISFLREKFIPDGPANGGDGGTGGSIYIQAVKGETSLHKLARRGILKAGRGKNGMGKGRGGERGEDILIQVPIGTTVREISRRDPLEEQRVLERQEKAFGRDAVFDGEEDGRRDQLSKWRRDKWLLYPGALPRTFTTAEFPALPRARRSNLTAPQPAAPIRLDLDSPMENPTMLASGALGGLGNPHFVTKSITRPKFATKGDDAISLQIHLELKLLADVGLVGLPNAGKSTLLRSLTRSRARVGSWAFTTLQPNVGTVILDDHKGRVQPGIKESFTIADIPGLIEDAHLDRGLGLGFLRHVERAAVLAFVVDLSGADAVQTLKSLWREVTMFETYREREVHAESERRSADGKAPVARDALGGADMLDDLDRADEDMLSLPIEQQQLDPLRLQSISSKPWMVVATKADLPETEANFESLRQYVELIEQGREEHPSGRWNAWRKQLRIAPVSAINAHGVDRIVPAVLELLEGRSSFNSK